jgi:hypothetical protein
MEKVDASLVPYLSRLMKLFICMSVVILQLMLVVITVVGMDIPHIMLEVVRLTLDKVVVL